MRSKLFNGSLILVIFMILVQAVIADSITVSGFVSGTWDVDTVYVTDDISIPEGESLVIFPGTLIRFEGMYALYVRGSLQAQGLEGNPVIFKSGDTTGFSVDTLARGGWNGIRFYYTDPGADSSIMEYCIFHHGKAVSQDSLRNYGGALSIQFFDKVRIDHCTFEDNFAFYNGGAVYLEEADVLIRNSVFTGNRCGPPYDPYGYGGAVCSDHSEVIILDNSFNDNYSTGVGGAVAIRFRDARLCNNSFTLNYSALGGAVGFLHYYENFHSQCNNLFTQNGSVFFGGGIACIDAGPLFVNNTIAYNQSVYGGGLYVKDSLIPALYNCILWGNTASGPGPQVYLWDSYASADFYYCNVQGGWEMFAGSGGGAGYTGIYENNIQTNPEFTDTLSHDLTLSAGSPCINAGTPDTTGLFLYPYCLAGNARVIGGRIDMGCYESLFTGLQPSSALSRPGIIRIFPNPAQSETRIEFFLENIQYLELSVYDISGRLVKRENLGLFPEGLGQTIWNPDVKPGTYIICFRSGSGESWSKLVVSE
ncbi:MAG: T9SS type A sorting domain-containing protein [Bacteroidetes bacterium]|nr:T9SS type A sorting domain-containing protein [Bacteroidota bacterium]